MVYPHRVLRADPLTARVGMRDSIGLPAPRSKRQHFDREGRSSGHALIFQAELMPIQHMIYCRRQRVKILLFSRGAHSACGAGLGCTHIRADRNHETIDLIEQILRVCFRFLDRQGRRWLTR